MSDLQILLITVGVILIALVVLYNSWQDWRARKSMRQAQVEQAPDDVLMQQPGERREPRLAQESGPAPTDAESAPAAVVPPEAIPAEDNAEVDATCEVVMDIVLAQPVSGESLAPALQAISRVGKKPVRVLAAREGGGHRSQVRAGESYGALQLAVVLANRSGPLTAIEWSNLWALAQGLAERFDGQIEAPEQDDVLQRAAKLDECCASMDAQVGLILQLSQPMSLDDIHRHAQESGFVRQRHQWLWMVDSKLPHFVLQHEAPAQGDVVHRVDLMLDVPNNVPDNQAFSRMVAIGRDLASRLQAHLLDDQGRTFEDRSAAAIDQQLSDLYDRLDAAGFLAGSERAARVFS